MLCDITVPLPVVRTHCGALVLCTVIFLCKRHNTTCSVHRDLGGGMGAVRVCGVVT